MKMSHLEQTYSKCEMLTFHEENKSQFWETTLSLPWKIP